jgi:hypothetical protein
MHSLMVFFHGRLVNLPPLHGIVKGELVKNVEILPKTYKYAYYNICLVSTPIFGGGPSVLHIFLFFRVVFYCFVCLCPVSCVAGVPGLSFEKK